MKNVFKIYIPRILVVFFIMLSRKFILFIMMTTWKHSAVFNWQRQGNFLLPVLSLQQYAFTGSKNVQWHSPHRSSQGRFSVQCHVFLCKKSAYLNYKYSTSTVEDIYVLVFNLNAFKWNLCNVCSIYRISLSKYRSYPLFFLYIYSWIQNHILQKSTEEEVQVYNMQICIISYFIIHMPFWICDTGGECYI